MIHWDSLDPSSEYTTTENIAINRILNGFHSIAHLIAQSDHGVTGYICEIYLYIIQRI